VATAALWTCGGGTERDIDAGAGNASHAGSSTTGGTAGHVGGGHAGTSPGMTAGASATGSGGAGPPGAGNGSAGSGGTGSAQNDGFPPAQQLPRGLLEFFGSVDDPGLDNASSGASLWTNLFSVDESRALSDIGLWYGVQATFTGHFVVYESETREGSYRLIFQQPVLMTRTDPVYELYLPVEGVTLEATKFYAIGVMVGGMQSGTVYATAAFSEGNAPRRVSFGEQFGATYAPVSGMDGPPAVVMVTTAENAGRRFAAQLVTR
jgi:hypothetical protein